MKHPLALTSAAIALSLGMASLAHAQSTQVNGLYFEAKLNLARAKVDDGSGNKVKFRDQGLGLGLGYKIDPSLAVEAGYDSLGKDQGIKLRGAYAGLVASYPLTPELTGRFKAGVINVESKLNGVKVDRNRLYLGAGVDYPIAPELSLTGDYRYTKVDGEAIHTFSLGTKYAF